MNKILKFLLLASSLTFMTIGQYIYRTGDNSFRNTFCNKYDAGLVEKVITDRERTADQKIANLFGAQIARVAALKQSVQSCTNKNFPTYVFSRTRGFMGMVETPSGGFGGSSIGQ